MPRKNIRSAGVANIPITLPIIALHSDEATFPPAAAVRRTHILTVVGRHVRTKIPSNNVGGKRLGTIFFIVDVKGRPIKKGHAKKEHNWTNIFNLKFVIAFCSSDNSRDNPDSRNMHVTPNLPINNSGLRIPPLAPSY